MGVVAWKTAVEEVPFCVVEKGGGVAIAGMSFRARCSLLVWSDDGDEEC